MLALPSSTVLVVNILAALVLSAAVIASAVASDRFGRKRVLLVGTLLGIVAGPIAFASCNRAARCRSSWPWHC